MINKNNLLLLFVVFSIFIFSIYKILKTEEKLLIEYENINGTPVVINAPQNISGDLIIIAHGFAGSTSFMRSIAVSLASSGHIAVRFDFLGHGKNNFPFHGDVTSVNGPTQEFLLQLNSIIETYKKKYNFSKVVLLGHSMATDLIIRSANSRDDIKSVIGISTYSNEKLKNNFPNLLILNGEWESGLRKKSKDILKNTGINNPDENTLYGSFKEGNARLIKYISAVDHVSILYSSNTQREINKWLRLLNPHETEIVVNKQGFWLLIIFLSLFFIFLLIVRIFPEKEVGKFDINIYKFLLINILSIIFIPFLLKYFSIEFLVFPVHNYIINHLLLLSIIIITFTPLTYKLEFKKNFNFLVFVFLLFYFLGVFGLTLDKYVSSYFIGLNRAYIFLFLMFACIPFYIILQILYTFNKYGFYLANLLKINLIFAFSLSIFLNFQELFLLSYSILIFIIFSLVFGFLINILNKRHSNFLSSGIANGVMLAWTFTSTIPIYRI